jgi:hypothetical protein
MSEKGLWISVPVDKLKGHDVKILALNETVSEIVKAYLEYCQDVLAKAMTQSGYDAQRFKDIGDELVLTPQELIEFIDKLQIALAEI